jgi:ATP-dependent DNA helicase RecG
MALRYNTPMHLKDQIATTFRINEFQTKALKKLGVVTIEDLLYHFPVRYGTTGEGTSIVDAPSGGKVTVYGTISQLKARKAWKRKIPMAQATLQDGTGTVSLTWLHQPYIAKMIPEGATVKVSGKLTTRPNGPARRSLGAGGRSMMNPEIEVIPEGSVTLPTEGELFLPHASATGLWPVYPESRGITSRWFYHVLQKVFTPALLDALDDPVPEDLLKRYNLPTLKTALLWIHTPKNEKDAKAARKRFAFEEVFLIQLKRAQERKAADALPSWNIADAKEHRDAFVDRFPFKPTNAQERAIEAILEDFASPHAMSRLLEGDVGSGKTFVAAVTAHAVVTSRPDASKDFGNLQVAYMAPTEILANQHFESFIEFFKDLPIQIGLITSSACKKFPSKVNPRTWTDISRAQLLKWVGNGEIPILIGTHSLIQKSVKFKHLAYIIIDEQHRFGTRQRSELAQKTGSHSWRLPHLLSMTATPIPRTLALTIYGDLDLTLLDEMPLGRKDIRTKIVKPGERDAMYEHVRSQIKEGRQAYVICPRIDEPDPAKELALRAKSVTEEAKRLQRDVFPDLRIGTLHGKMTAAAKEKTMKEFSEGALDILVATSVIEVGVNVPNATVIVIEGAERFGLSQLHQLRGRVLRSSHQAYCYLLTETKGETSLKRLKALTQATNGFELAEHDLQLRGAGELYGRQQWGITDVGMEALQNIKMVEAARSEAHALIEEDPELAHHPLLASALTSREALHFE